MTKALEKPRGWQMLVPWAAENVQRPHTRDLQGGQMPHSSAGMGGEGLGAAGIDRCINKKII